MPLPRSLAQLTQPIAREALGRKSAALGTVLADWPDIVGPELAARATPEKLAPARRAEDGGILTLRTTPAAALEIQHDAPRILQRVNAYLGFQAVARIALRQAPPGRRSVPPGPPKRVLGPSDERDLDRVLKGIGDEPLHDALAGLGRSVYGRRTTG